MGIARESREWARKPFESSRPHPAHEPHVPRCWFHFPFASICVIRGSFLEKVRHETAEVARDAAGVFTEAETGGLMIDDPYAAHHAIAVELGEIRRRLVDVPLIAVV